VVVEVVKMITMVVLLEVLEVVVELEVVLVAVKQQEEEMVTKEVLVHQKVILVVMELTH
jgi:hypothetical protein